MPTKSSYRRQIPEPEMYLMENRLGAVLHGVSPRPDFVNGLRSRLETQPVQVRNNVNVMQYVILSLVGLVSGVVLIVAGVRAVSALLSLRGMVRPTGQEPVLEAS